MLSLPRVSTFATIFSVRPPKKASQIFNKDLNSGIISFLFTKHALAIIEAWGFAHIKAFSANLRVPRRCFESLNSFSRSIQLYDSMRMRRRGFFRKSKLITRI